MSRSSSTLNSATWIRSARSGSSLRPKTPRLVRGTQAVVHGLGVAEGAALGHLDRVDVADEVADAGVGGGELLGVAVVCGAATSSGRSSPSSASEAPAAGAHRRQRVVVDLAAGDDGDPLVEQPDQGAHQPGLALAALAEQHQVVAGEQGALELGQDGVVEADDAGEGRLARAQPVEQVLADLLLDGARGVAGVAQLAQRRRAVRVAHAPTLRLPVKEPAAGPRSPPGVAGPSLPDGALEHAGDEVTLEEEVERHDGQRDDDGAGGQQREPLGVLALEERQARAVRCAATRRSP